MLGDQLEQNFKTLLGSKRPVVSSIRIFGFLEGTEDTDLLFREGHDPIISCPEIAGALPELAPRW